MTVCFIGDMLSSNGCEVPPIQDVCWSVTSYWPFDSDLNPTPYNGQADSNPSITANGTEISHEMEWDIAAVPFHLVGSTLVFPNGHEVSAADTFGDIVYQAGVFYHGYWGRFVIGVDVLSPDGLFYLECQGEIK